MITIKTPEMIQRMREAGRIAANARELAGQSIAPGMTTRELDEIVHAYILKEGAKPSFLHYNGYPASVCISINDQVVHGIPGDRVMQEGDIISVDVGAYYKGFHGDTAATFACGTISPSAQQLIDVTRESFFKGVEMAVPGNRVGDIGHAVEQYVKAFGYAPVRILTGHGVGRNLHEDPEVLNYGKPHTGDQLRAGMVIAIEPMINEGTHRVRFLEDGWTTVTADGKLSAHYEHTVAITDHGPVLLTAL